MKPFLLLAFSLSLLKTVFCFSTDTIRIESDVLNETREAWIYYPDRYSDNDTVVVFYMLDGEFSGYLYEKINEHKGKYPVVGIGIINVDRRRDILPGESSGLFAGFINEELIPVIEKNLHVKKRILFGHSFGGSFVLNTLLNNPQKFNSYLVSSPTPIMKMLEGELYRKADSSLNKPVDLLISYGTKDMRQVRKWTPRLIENLRNTPLKYISWDTEVFIDAKHSETSTRSIISFLKKEFY